jgi:hypothetical protein
VLVNPGIQVDVYQTTGSEPKTNEEVINACLRIAQANPDLPAQVILPPTSIQINGKAWSKAGMVMKIQHPEVKSGPFELYAEVYIHVFDEKNFFFVQFSAAKGDVPPHRKDIDNILRSIRITEPAGIQPRSTTEL